MFNLLQAAQQSPGGGYGTLIMLGAMILVFWLFFIRPQAKKAKQQKQFINDLQKGTKVVTIAGIHGTINKINEDGTFAKGTYLIHILVNGQSIQQKILIK